MFRSYSRCHSSFPIILAAALLPLSYFIGGGGGHTLYPLAPPRFRRDLRHAVPLFRGHYFQYCLQRRSWKCYCLGYAVKSVITLWIPTQLASIGSPSNASAESVFPCGVYVFPRHFPINLTRLSLAWTFNGAYEPVKERTLSPFE